MKLDLDYANSLKLILPEEKTIGLSLVGCGGTGSWLAPAICRVGKLLQERFHKEVRISFFDPDTVEENNIYRQNFSAAELGRNKAETLAARFGLAWGIEINAVPEKFDHPEWDDLTLVIGCVDNAEARRMINNSIGNRGWWLDSGNEKNSGQILLGSHRGMVNKRIFDLDGFCGWLPAPDLQHPELVQEADLKPAIEENLSCAEMALQDSQGLAINQRMAAEAADYLVRMLITKDLRKFATYIDLESGSTRSKYITQKEIGRWLK